VGGTDDFARDQIDDRPHDHSGLPNCLKASERLSKTTRLLCIRRFSWVKFPVLAKKFPVPQKYFPVSLRRELRGKSLRHSGFLLRNRPQRPRSECVRIGKPPSGPTRAAQEKATQGGQARRALSPLSTRLRVY
jgi:hypothetical protein